MKRAHTVQRYLIKKGVDPRSIRIKAYGESRYIKTNNPEEFRKVIVAIKFKEKEPDPVVVEDVKPDPVVVEEKEKDKNPIAQKKKKEKIFKFNFKVPSFLKFEPSNHRFKFVMSTFNSLLQYDAEGSQNIFISDTAPSLLLSYTVNLKKKFQVKTSLGMNTYEFAQSDLLFIASDQRQSSYDLKLGVGIDSIFSIWELNVNYRSYHKSDLILGELFQNQSLIIDAKQLNMIELENILSLYKGTYIDFITGLRYLSVLSSEKYSQGSGYAIDLDLLFPRLYKSSLFASFERLDLPNDTSSSS